MEEFKMTGNQLYKGLHRVNGRWFETILELFESSVVSECQPRYLYRFSATMQGSDLTVFMEKRCYELQDVMQLVNDFLKRYCMIAFPETRSVSNE